MATTVEARDMFDKLLVNYEFWKFLRITSWIFRLLSNCRRTKQSCPLTTSENSEGIYVCNGRIEGAYPIYLPNESLLLEKIIFAAHKNTLHWVVLMTMTNV